MFMVLFDGVCGSVQWWEQSMMGVSERITDVGKAKHENIIKIIYFSAAIVFPSTRKASACLF